MSCSLCRTMSTRLARSTPRSASPALSLLRSSKVAGAASFHTTPATRSKPNDAPDSRSNSSRTFDADSRPAPPRLPPHLQKEFEELQKRAAAPLAGSQASSSTTASSITSVDLDEHPDIRKKPKPEFDGEINPRTGEVGGPKNDPLSYEKEWTYGGRATDF